MCHEVIGTDTDGSLICRADEDGEIYNCGETLEEYGVHNLRPHELRRLELDAWLEELDARVIHVTDLGAAMEAQEWGALCVDWLTAASRRAALSAAAAAHATAHAATAAHHARRALSHP